MEFMDRVWLVIVAFAIGGLVSSDAFAQSFEAEVTPLVETSCLSCHGDRTVTPLNLNRLGFDLTDRETFQTWARIVERVEQGEMPPPAMPRPDAAVVERALGAVKSALVDANLVARAGQRTPLRRLTRLEYQYTIQDLLGIDPALALEFSQLLPAEADSGGFDTVAVHQGFSALHVRSYLDVADRALDAAIMLGPRPATVRHEIDYAKSQYLYFISRAKTLGLGIVKQLDDSYVAFFDFGSTYTFHSEQEGFHVPAPGRYHVTLDAYPYQAYTPVTVSLYRGIKAGAAASLDELLGSFDLVGDVPRTVEVTPFLRPGDLISPSVADLDLAPGIATFPFPIDSTQGFADVVKDYKGEGVAMQALTIEGPLFDAWPPESTRQLLTGVEFDDADAIHLTKDPYDYMVDIVAAVAPRAFRRPLEAGELEFYTSLAEPLLVEGRPFLDAVRVPLRAILSARAFLFQAGAPGQLDNFALASRLSYFLWRSMPDAELLEVARAGQLSDATVLRQQVDRMLDDAKSARFVEDFAGQAFRLYELRATAPDRGLYPEYSDRLGQAMERETELFLAELIAEDRGVEHLISADFTFVNRSLAEHYDLPGVEGQHMRKVTLPADSPRGGLLTQASVLKITANGTTTSPVSRGNFVLANLLGQPAPPPPGNVAGLEPDTRGTTTIREQLEAHRSSPVCASCHRAIDPPGFALESFNPIGGFRTTYRVSGGEIEVDGRMKPAPYTEGPAVDPSGVTSAGDAFAGIEEYKRLLLEHEVEQVARHFTSQLLVYATGAEIEFADRDEVERIVTELSDSGYPVRTMIHQVVQSDLFRNR